MRVWWSRLWASPAKRFDITPWSRPLLARCPDMDGAAQGQHHGARPHDRLCSTSRRRSTRLVVGTSNRTETLLGYFTMHGDGAAAFKPIAHLYKCQVRALSRHLGVPEAIIDKAPSADLWEGQTDEGELGFTYDEADQVLYLLTERGWPASRSAAAGL